MTCYSYVLSGAQIALGVHVCGLFIDLLVGFVLFFDGTRKLGLFISMMFHVLNSMMFNIGRLVTVVLLAYVEEARLFLTSVRLLYCIVILNIGSFAGIQKMTNTSDEK